MNINYKKIQTLVIIILATIIGCKKIKDYPTTPQIEFKDSKVQIGNDILGNKIHKVTLHFYLIDGDGNVGLPPNPGNTYIGDSAYNYFSELFYLKDGKWNHDTLILDKTKKFILPDVTKFLGTNDLLKADIFIDYEYTSLLFHYDSIKYSLYVMDRFFNKSNTIYSDTIIIAEK